MRISTSNSLIGSTATFATLTAAYTGNQSGGINVLNCENVTLDVMYIPGATNQYASILIEHSSKDTPPSADADWAIYPAQSSSVGETAMYDNPVIVPGDKVSSTSSTERIGVSKDIIARWMRISVREHTNAGGTPTTFGTVHIRLIKRELD